MGNNERVDFSRALSIESEQHFKQDAHISALLEIAKAKSLVLCFRGKYINIYHNGANVLKVLITDDNNKTRKNFTASFNFKYARFNKNHAKIREDLESRGVSITKFNIPLDKNEKMDNDKAITATIPFKKVKICDLEFIVDTLIDLINQFTKSENEGKIAYDYFYDTSGEKKFFIEKKRQHEIFLANQNNPDFFIFDMEYAQSRENNKATKVKGRFDMQGLRKIGENKYALVLIELKSKISACHNRNSGVVQHKQDLEDYINCGKYNEYRINDAKKIMRLNKELFNLSYDENCLIDNNIQKLFIFTDEACDYTNSNEFINLGLSNAHESIVLHHPFKLTNIY